MLAEALFANGRGRGRARVLENLSAAAMDFKLAELPQHKRRWGLPAAGALQAGFIPYADDWYVALPAEAVPLPPSAQLLPPM